MRTEHLVIVNSQCTGRGWAYSCFTHYCLDEWCQQRCSIKHSSASDAAGCATKYHTVSCYCIGSDLMHIDVDTTESLF